MSDFFHIYCSTYPYEISFYFKIIQGLKICLTIVPFILYIIVFIMSRMKPINGSCREAEKTSEVNDKRK